MAAADEDDYPKNLPDLDGVPDLSLLVHMEMGNVLDNLHFRYEKMSHKQIYTCVSTILIAVNPYEAVPHLDVPSFLEHFKDQADRGVQNMKPPHPFAVGARSYSRMMTRRVNQSVIVCGESGAGKTETTKRVIKYLAETTPISDINVGSIEMQIMSASPILEAFGNAKTILNNNSSRFGRFTKLLYSVDGDAGITKGAILGATLETYLLEKSRVIFQANQERNYHAFYFAFAGMPQEVKDQFGLTAMLDFHYTQQGGVSEVPGINDRARYEELKGSLMVNKVSETAQQEIFRLLAAIMHLGNINFDKDDQDYGVVSADSGNHLALAAQLFGVEPDELTKRLQTTSAKFGKKKIAKKINHDACPPNRDAISKGVYEKLFLYLAERINSNLSDIDESILATDLKFIGVLDVFGFENFDVNSLEQFCINFTNEKLQDFFNTSIIASEQEEYIKESVVWTEIEVPNCGPLLNLVENDKSGLFLILDSCCQGGGATTEFLEQEFFKKNKGNALLKRAKGDRKKKTGGGKKGKKKGKKKGGQKGFFGAEFSHFADDVVYNFQHFITKNMEKVSADTKKMFNASTNSLAKQIAGGKGKSKKKSKTLTAQFSGALNKLMKNLRATEPYFVRCVNPNMQKRGDIYVRKVVEDQLRCGGILEALNVLKLGYPTRVEYQILYDRFHDNVQSPLVRRLQPDKFAAAVLIAFGVDEAEYELGLTKIFFKPAKAAVLEEIMNFTEELTQEQNDLILNWLATARISQLFGALKTANYLKNKIRDSRALVRWQEVGWAVSKTGVALVRYLEAAKRRLSERKRREAATAIQAYYKAYRGRQVYAKKAKKVKKACKVIFRAHQKYQVRASFMSWLTDAAAERVAERKRKEEEERKRREEEEQERLRLSKIAEEKSRLAEEARIAEEKRLRKIEEKKQECVDHVGKTLAGVAFLDEIIASSSSKEEAIDKLNAKVDSISSDFVNGTELLEVVPEGVEDVRKNLQEKYSAQWDAEEERKRKEAEEKQRLRKEKEEEEARKQKLMAEAVKRKTALVQSEEAMERRRTKMAQKKAEKEVREERVIVQQEEYEDAKEEKMQEQINEVMWNEKEEDEDEDEPEEAGGATIPIEYSLEKFIRDSSTGQLFKKHKYRKRAQDPNERFIQITYDATRTVPQRITWGTNNRFIDWSQIKLIAHGHYTPTFTQRKETLPPETCVSVVSRHTILDIQNDDPAVVLFWVKGLRELLGQSNQEANKLQQELVNNPPDPRKKQQRKPRGQAPQGGQPKPPKEKQRTESLILLQKDLFIMTTTTVFRSLEEQYYPITQELKEKFNPNVMYQKALDNDVPWRNWQKWIEEQVKLMMKAEGLGGPATETKQEANAVPPAPGGPVAADNKDCSVQ